MNYIPREHLFLWLSYLYPIFTETKTKHLLHCLLDCFSQSNVASLLPKWNVLASLSKDILETGSLYLGSKRLSQSPPSISRQSSLSCHTYAHKRTRRGSRGGSSPPPNLGEIFKNQPHSGKFLSLVGQKCGQAIGFVSDSPLDFFFPYA